MRCKHIAHTHLWQNVPRGLRRRVLFHLTANLAPRPTPDAAATSPIIVAGLLRTASGLGEGARLCHDALSQCGHVVYGIDLSECFRQPGPVVPFKHRDGRSVEGQGTLILHINGPYMPLALMRLGRRFLKGKKIIGYWAWELPSVPAEWRLGVPFVHEIWVPSRFTARAIEGIAGEIPVRVIPHPVAARGVPVARPCRRGGRFTGLLAFNMASSFTRKNPLAAINAFKEAFDRDPTCQLIVRVVNPNSYPEGYKVLMEAVASLGNVRISEADTDRASIDDLYASADFVISLHRSEGFGLVIAEAMLHELPVVATNWSGNVDFLTSANGFPVRYSLAPSFDPQGTYDDRSCMWAEADVHDAASKLSSMREDPISARAIGIRAAEDASNVFGLKRYIRSVRDILGVQTEDVLQSECSIDDRLRAP
jgi:glycosyltransferase involved in cell wall biosynthesis